MAVQKTMFNNVHDYENVQESEEITIDLNNKINNTYKTQSEEKTQLIALEHRQELENIETDIINPLQGWSEIAAQEYFETIKKMQSLIDSNIDKDDQMTIQGNTFDLKQGLEKILSLTGILPQYIVLNEDYSFKNANYKVQVKCIITTKNKVPLAVGVASCSSFDNKEAYQWLYESDIPKWRWETRTPDGIYDKNEPKRIHDYPNDIWILKEDLINKDGKYKIAYTLAEYRENQHKIYRKAHIRALREAVSYALNRTSHIKKSNKPKGDTSSQKTDFKCSKCNKILTEKESKFIKSGEPIICYKCKIGA